MPYNPPPLMNSPAAPPNDNYKPPQFNENNTSEIVFKDLPYNSNLFTPVATITKNWKIPKTVGENMQILAIMPGLLPATGCTFMISCYPYYKGILVQSVSSINLISAASGSAGGSLSMPMVADEIQIAVTYTGTPTAGLLSVYAKEY